MHSIQKTLCLLALASGSSLMAAAVPCPTVGTNAAYTGAGGGCNTEITIAANGSISTAVVNPNPYDGVEDTLVGVINNSSAPVTSLNIAGSNIFGFDGDGICTYAFAGNSYCSASQSLGTDPGDYQGPTSTFSTLDNNTGTVLFSGGDVAANGGMSYFSLEEPPTANLVVTSGTPEPASMALLGAGLSALYFLRRRRKA